MVFFGVLRLYWLNSGHKVRPSREGPLNSSGHSCFRCFPKIVLETPCSSKVVKSTIPFYHFITGEFPLSTLLGFPAHVNPRQPTSTCPINPTYQDERHINKGFIR